jgi:PAS domain S-box-containing protein
VWIREEAILVDDEDGNPQFWLGLMLDVTDTVRTERELQEAQTKYGVLVEQIPAIVYVDLADERMSTSYVSPQIEALLGITPEEYIDDPDMWVTHLHPRTATRRSPPTSRDERRRTVHVGVPPDRTRRARAVVQRQRRRRARRGGAPLFVQGVMLDITQRKEAEEEIAFLALPRQADRPPQPRHVRRAVGAVARPSPRQGLGVSVISLDIDNFKLVNDSLGHDAGDELISLFSERLREATREADLIARPGADEFLMLLADLDRTSAVAGCRPALFVAESVAARIQDALAGAVRGRGHRALRDGIAGDQRVSEPRRERRDDPEARRQRDGRSKQLGPGGSFMHAASTFGSHGQALAEHPAP